MSQINSPGNRPEYKWYILTLVSLTAIFIMAMPTMAIPVLFKEISEDLNLSLVQVGATWGIMALSGMFAILVGGLLADRYGSKRVLVTGCFLAGLAGILRGFSDSFTTLIVTMFLYGLLTTLTGPGIIKALSTWFQGKRLGLANGVMSTCFGFGFMVGAMISATFLSPWLGGWRNVLFFYGGLSIAVSLLWMFSRDKPVQTDPVSDSPGRSSFWDSIKFIARKKRIWLLALIMAGQVSAVQGTLGYLPLYLRDIGWAAVAADGALSAFHGISMLVTVPLTLLSDKLNSRKIVLLLTTLATAVGFSLLSIASGWGIWVSVLIAGMVRDGFMALHITMVIETEDVGSEYAGTAIGLIHTVGGLTEFASPPIGNSLAGINPRLPFGFWGALAALALFAFIPLKEKKRKTGVY